MLGLLRRARRTNDIMYLRVRPPYYKPVRACSYDKTLQPRNRRNKRKESHKDTMAQRHFFLCGLVPLCEKQMKPFGSPWLVFPKKQSISRFSCFSFVSWLICFPACNRPVAARHRRFCEHVERSGEGYSANIVAATREVTLYSVTCP